MALQYSYVKERYMLNRPYGFFLRNEILVNYPPVKNERKKFIRREMMDRSTQMMKTFAASEVNTDCAEYVSDGMFHIEGGWPKDVDMQDEEQMIRHTKKLTRSEEYRVQMSRNLEAMKKAVMQNAGVNVYENYFDKFDSANVCQCFSRRDAKTTMPACKLSFGPEESPKIAVAYSLSVYTPFDENATHPLVWDINSNENPFVQLNCDSSCSSIEYSMRYANVIAGGLQNGQVCVWDIRIADPQIITNADKGHRGCVQCVRWSSREKYEIASGSSNGEVFLWDIRKISQPLSHFQIEVSPNSHNNKTLSVEEMVHTTVDEMIDASIDGAFVSNADGIACSALEFDKIHSEQLLIGKSDGNIVVARRIKRDDYSEELSNVFEMNCHYAPVSTVAQNWASDKCILTVDACAIKVWRATLNESIFSVSSLENEFSCGIWSRTRYSRFFIGKVDGSIQFWDLTYHHNEPYFSLKPASGFITDIQAHSHGKLIGCCYENGDVYTIELSDKLVGPINDQLVPGKLLALDNFCVEIPEEEEEEKEEEKQEE